MAANGTTSAAPTRAVSSTARLDDNEAHVAAFWTRYEHLKVQDVMKNLLLEDVITRYENLCLKHAAYVREREGGDGAFAEHRRREEELVGNINQLQFILNRDPFVIVLIDGDSLIFNADFLSAGEEGGKTAACLLHDAVHEWTVANIADISSEFRIAVRVLANVKGLANACVKAGLIRSTDQVEAFARGFMRGNPLFDFIDVGSGKDRAAGKVIDNLKMYLHDYHCRQIILGCSNDNGYTQLLEQYVSDKEALSRITLLEGAPSRKESAGLPYDTAKFAGLFRETKINTFGPPDLLSTHSFRPRVDSRGLSATSEVFSPKTQTPFSPLGYAATNGIPHMNEQLRNQRLRNMSIESSATSSEAGLGSWAAVTKSSSGLPFTDLPKSTRPVEPEEKLVLRNIKGQRVDEPLEYDRDEIQRLKKHKLCNQHYVGQGCCHYNAGKADKCPHKHDVTLTPQELYWLRVVARETPCKKGPGCDDTRCIYGHRCPFPKPTEGSNRGATGSCLNGENCRFPREMHTVDPKIVKMTKVTGRF